MTTIDHRKAILYPKAHWYFALAILVTWIGFSRSYFGRLPQTDLAHHLHGLSAGLWMGLLVAQPMLYQRGLLRLHRQLGWAGVLVLVPALVVGGLKMVHTMVRSANTYPPGAVFPLSFTDVISLALFLLFLGLSLRHGRQLALHARYMACTVLVTLQPAIGRVLLFLPGIDSFGKALNGSFVLLELLLLVLILDDRRMGSVRSPYPVALLLYFLLHVATNLVGSSSAWQRLMDEFSHLAL